MCNKVDFCAVKITNVTTTTRFSSSQIYLCSICTCTIRAIDPFNHSWHFIEVWKIAYVPIALTIFYHCTLFIFPLFFSHFSNQVNNPTSKWIITTRHMPQIRDLKIQISATIQIITKLISGRYKKRSKLFEYLHLSLNYLTLLRVFHLCMFRTEGKP